jgi:hypothetical protein
MKPKVVLILGICILILGVIPVNALIAMDDYFDIMFCSADGNYQGSVLTNDNPNDYPNIKAVLLVGAIPGHVDLYEDGNFRYYPGTNYWNSATTSSSSFVYRTFDGEDYSNPARVYLSVNHDWIVNGKDITIFTNKDTPVTFSLPRRYDILQFSLHMGQPSYGTLTYLTRDPDFLYYLYTPQNNFEGIDQISYYIHTDMATCGDMYGEPGTITINVGNSTPTPEFPTMLLPATMIIGFLGAVFYIQRTREH